MLECMERPIILESEVKSTLTKMKRKKAAGSNENVIEILTVLDNLVIDTVTEEINEI